MKTMTLSEAKNKINFLNSERDLSTKRQNQPA